MKRLSVIAISVAVLCLVFATPSAAQRSDAPGQGRQKDRPVLAGPRAGTSEDAPSGRRFSDGQADRRMQMAARLDELIEALDLTEEQAAQVRELVAERQVEAMTGRREMAQTMREMRQARQSGDAEAAQAAREKLAALREASRPDRGAMLREIAGLLNDEQKQRLRDHLAAQRRDRAIAGPTAPRQRAEVEPGERLRQAFQQLDLTEAQQQHIEQRIDEYRSSVQALREKHGERMRQLREELRSAQQAGDAEAAEQARQQMRELWTQAEGPSIRDLMTDIRKQLTPDQQQQMREMIQQQRRSRAGEDHDRPGDNRNREGNRDRDRGADSSEDELDL